METLTGSRIDLQKNTLAIVLAGGRGTRLGPLTDKRVKPAVHFGGKYRIVDFALSNCLNSGIRRIAVVTQYKAHSLLRHLQRGWGFPARRVQRIHRHLAGPAARGRQLVPRHRGRGVPEPRHHPLHRARVHHRAGGRSRLQDGLHAHGARSRRERCRLHGGLYRGAAHGSGGIWRDACG